MHVVPKRHMQEYSQEHYIFERAKTLKSTQVLIGKMDKCISTYSHDGILHSTEDEQITMTTQQPRRISQQKMLSRETRSQKVYIV